MRNFHASKMPVLLLLLAGLFWLTDCGPKSNSVSVGLISPFTGDGANYGKAARNGVDMAVDEINESGGINGKKLTVIYEDDQGTPTGAISAFQKLASVNRVPLSRRSIRLRRHVSGKLSPSVRTARASVYQCGMPKLVSCKVST